MEDEILEYENANGLANAYDRAVYLIVLTTHYSDLVEARLSDTALTLFPDVSDATYTISPSHPFYDCGDFVKDLKRWVNVFNVEQTKIGVNDDQLWRFHKSAC